MPAGPGQILGSQIDSISNAPYIANVGSDGRLWVDLGGDIVISGVEIDSVVIKETSPIDDNKNNPAWEFGYTGSVITTITQFIDAGSYVQTLTYDIGSSIINIGSWS